MPWLPYFLICVLVIWWQPNTWTNVCVLVDYIQHFRSKGWKHEENKLKKPTKTQRLKPSKEKQNIPIHRLNRWRQKIYVGAVVRKAGNWKYTHRLNRRWRYWIRRCNGRRRPRKMHNIGWTNDAPVNYVGVVVQRVGFAGTLGQLHSPIDYVGWLM